MAKTDTENRPLFPADEQRRRVKRALQRFAEKQTKRGRGRTTRQRRTQEN